MSSSEPLVLTVSEAYPEDASRVQGMASIDQRSMKALGARERDAIRIAGKTKWTFARCAPLRWDDENKGIIRVGDFIRENAGISLGERVRIEKSTHIPNAANVLIRLPKEKEWLSSRIPGEYILDALDGALITGGRDVMLPYFGQKLRLEVVQFTPKVEVAVIDRSSSIKFSPKP